MSFTRWPKLSLKLQAAQHLRFPEPQRWIPVLWPGVQLPTCSPKVSAAGYKQESCFSHLSFAAMKVSGASRNAGRVSLQAHTINHSSTHGFSFLLPQTRIAESLPPCQPHNPSDRGQCLLQMRLSPASSHQQEAIPVSQHSLLCAPVLCSYLVVHC